MGTVFDKMSRGGKLPPKEPRECYNPNVIKAMIERLREGYRFVTYNTFTGFAKGQEWETVLTKGTERLVFTLSIGLPFMVSIPTGETLESVVLHRLEGLLVELQ